MFLRAAIGFSPIPDRSDAALRFPGVAVSSVAVEKEMKKIGITLYVTLRAKRPDLAERGATDTEAATIGELLAELNITREEAAIVFLNSKKAGLDSELQDGDKVDIFPMLGGG